uniref:RNase H type-1 domain-containing protein n=1 Tax=Musa acuminata subsp. malaccensis TaxID=214687 RepID=A0A804L6R9_MUSAM|nr:PREDICTED: uncharacterized protein LOC103973313 [Musa acuminata subsp. malaccensis]
MTIALTGFIEDSISPLGTTVLPITLGEELRMKTLMTAFMVVDLPSAYNVILGRSTLNRIQAVVSTYHRTIKFPTSTGIGGAWSDPRESRRCYLTTVALPPKPRPTTVPDPREASVSQMTLEPPKSLIEVPLKRGRPVQTIRIGTALPEADRLHLVDYLRENADQFAWSPEEMLGIDLEVAQHRLNVDPGERPIRQKLRRFTPDQQRVIRDEADRFIKAGFIAEVKIDQLVDATVGHERLTFLDAFSGYNQIWMATQDREDTTFVTNQGAYCYKVMPFGLKNTDATYQRMVDKLFKQQLGRNMEVYIDDMIVKSKVAGTHLADLAETFQTLRQFNLHLNPAKCVFGVSSGKFLGFIIHQWGIDTNPEKVRAITEMHSPRSAKEVQRLARRLAALSSFTWTPKCEEAFKKLKECLVYLPRLTSPELGETLGFYLVASPQAISSVLIREVPPMQQPMHYISHVLGGPEIRYPPIERLALILVLTARKLWPYFQAHTIKYSLRTAIKAQVLADFISELAPEYRAVGRQSGQGTWTLHIDGSSTSEGAGVGFVLRGRSGEAYERSLKLKFRATNNEAEYEALLHGLHLALELHVGDLEVFSDSQLVTGHINGSCEARDPTMISYLMEVKWHARCFDHFSVTIIPRAQNERANALAKLASTRTLESVPTTESMAVPTIPTHEVTKTNLPPNWIEEILRFKAGGKEPDDSAVTRRLRRAQAGYCIIGGRL